MKKFPNNLLDAILFGKYQEPTQEAQEAQEETRRRDDDETAQRMEEIEDQQFKWGEPREDWRPSKHEILTR